MNRDEQLFLQADLQGCCERDGNALGRFQITGFCNPYGVQAIGDRAEIQDPDRPSYRSGTFKSAIEIHRHIPKGFSRRHIKSRQ